SDGTLTITEFLVPNVRNPSSSSSSIATGRNSGGTDSRDGSGGSSGSTTGTGTSTTGQARIYGFEQASGRWGFNSQGNLIGFFAGDWYGTRVKSGVKTTEFFTLAADASGMNIYDVTGGGGNYSYSGVALLSRWKKIAFVLDLDDMVTGRATVGSFNLRRISFNT